MAVVDDELVSRIVGPALLDVLFLGVQLRSGGPAATRRRCGDAVLDASGPVYAFCLYIDVRKIGRSDAGWLPNPTVWGVVALLRLSSLLFPIPLV